MAKNSLTASERERMAIACSMMACWWAANPHAFAGSTKTANGEWARFESSGPELVKLSLYEAIEAPERMFIARTGRSWPPHIRFAAMEQLLRTGWNPPRPTHGKRGSRCAALRKGDGQ